MMNRQAAISAQGLRFGYSGRDVLRGLDLEVPAGATFLAGVNGAGKTTLMRLLLGEVSAAEGSLAVLGRPMATRKQRLDARGHVGYLPQQFGYPPRLTAAEFVAYLASLRGMRRRDLRSASLEALSRVGLSDRAGDAVGSLSGGMLRRVGIAQAIVTRPALLLLDEPTVGLDPAQRVSLRVLIAELSQEAAVVVSTHLLEDVKATADTLLVLHDGRMCFAGPPAALAGTREDGDLERAFLDVTQSPVLGVTA